MSAGHVILSKALYSDCQKNVPFAEGFFATTAYTAILLFGLIRNVFMTSGINFKVAGGSIFGIRSAPEVVTNAEVPIIPNIGSRCGAEVYHPHIAFEKITSPSDSMRIAASDRSLRECLPMLHIFPKPDI
jgi:hypothetical protein